MATFLVDAVEQVELLLDSVPELGCRKSQTKSLYPFMGIAKNFCTWGQR